MSRMSGLGEDARHALRSAAKTPGFIAAVGLILAAGVGLNFAAWRLVQSVFFPQLPFARPDALVAIHERIPPAASRRLGVPFLNLTYANYLLVRRQTQVFEGVGLYIPPSPNLSLDITEPGPPAKLRGAVVSLDLFRVLGVAPQLGPGFGLITGSPGSPVGSVAVISDRLWRQRFGGRASVLGRAVVINDRAYRVTGVMPPHFDFPLGSEIWLPGADPVTVNTIMNSQGSFFEFLPHAVGRLRARLTPAEAEAQLRAPLARMREPHLLGWPHVSLRLVPLATDLQGDHRGVAALLLAGTLLVLLNAWAVICILFWVRAARREREIAVRIALGATRVRAVLGTGIEIALVCLIGAVVAGATSGWAGRCFLAVLPTPGAGAQSGLAPASGTSYFLLVAIIGASAAVPLLAVGLRLGSLGLARHLQEPGLSVTASRRQRRLFSVLLGSQAALAFILTGAAAIAAGALWRAEQKPLGWQPAHLWFYSFSPHGASPALPLAAEDALRRVDEVARQPEVMAAALADGSPASEDSGETLVVTGAGGSTRALPAQGLQFTALAVTPDYFKAVGTRLERGRGFTRAECLGNAHVAVVDAAFARFFWGAASPLGRQIETAGLGTFTVVGEASQARLDTGIFSDAEPLVYLPFPQHLVLPLEWLLVRSRGAAPPPVPSIRRALAVGQQTPVAVSVQAASQALKEGSAAPENRKAVLLIFAALALLLAAAGSFAVASFVARESRREIAVRLALGSPVSRVMRILLVKVCGPMLAGVAASAAAVELFRPSLRLLAPDGITYFWAQLGVVALLAVGSGCLAALIGGWSIRAVNPAEILRQV
ncbi:MAG TPA: ABC transporter permease [Terriglobales bacterium]|nr:ABC transporter permease [Terriglobales bacterium]